MKFAYIDESGDATQSDVFVMGGLLLDHHRLRSKTAEFDQLLQDLFARHPGSPRELKSRAFMRGAGGWGAIPRHERYDYLRSVCELAVDNGDKIYAVALSLRRFAENRAQLPIQWSHWVAGGVFVASLIQKKMQTVSGGKGLTALVVDDNKVEMPALSDALYRGVDWCDGLYEVRRNLRGRQIWTPRTADDRFDHIVNTGFAVKSEHSSLVQVADAICWTFRRSLELTVLAEDHDGERARYTELSHLLHEERARLSAPRPSDALNWYRATKHEHWEL